MSGDDYERALAACALAAFIRELACHGSYTCQRCRREIPFRFQQTHVFRPWRDPVPAEHHAPCGLPCVSQFAFLVGFDEGVHGGEDGCPRCGTNPGQPLGSENEAAGGDAKKSE